MSTPSQTPLSNTDFRRFLTPMHPSMTAAAEEATPAAEKKPDATPAAGTKPSGAKPPVKYSDGTMKTVKITRHGLEGGDDGGEGGDEGEGEGDDDEGAAASSEGAAGSKRGPKVLSSRERSYIAFQAKQALKQEAKTRYRDRAKERQQDANPDYDAAAGISTTDLSIEASKFLGGDMQHTHMVKGLDFALLNKVRAELEQREEAKLEELVDAKRSDSHPDEAIPAAAPTTTKAPVSLVNASGVRFNSAWCASLFSVATAPPPPTGTDLFLPGRMAFSFPLHARPAHAHASTLSHAQQHINDLPSSVVTSVSDLAAAQASWAEEHVRGSLPSALWTKVVDIFQSQRDVEEERRKQRKARAHEPSGYNVTKEDHVKLPAAASEPTASTSAPPADEQTTDAAPMDMDYSVPLPPPMEDSDDDDIFAGAGSDYQARVEEPVYDVPRPPPDSDDDDEQPEAEEVEMETTPATAPTTAASKPLFTPSADEPAVRQLDKHASRQFDSDEDEDDIFVSDTAAGDELLAGSTAAGIDAQPLSADEVRKRKTKEIADAEYESLFPSHYAGYSHVIDDDEEDDDDKPKSKLVAGGEDGEAANAAAGKGGRRGKAQQPSEEELADRRFNAEYSQVTLMLKARGVNLRDDSKRRQTKPTGPEDDLRAIKRQKILRGFAQK